MESLGVVLSWESEMTPPFDRMYYQLIVTGMNSRYQNFN